MSSEDATTLSAVPVLKGDNYRLWARKMTAYLQVKGLYKYMRDSFIAPLDLNVTELTQMNAHDWNATNDDGTPLAVPPAIQALVDQRQNHDFNLCIRYYYTQKSKYRPAILIG